MYAVQTINTRDQWETVRTFWEWSNAADYAHCCRQDGYDVRIREVE